MYRIYISGTSFPDVTIYSGKDWQVVGEWPIKKEEAEIDIVAINSDSYLLRECKWRNKELDSRVLTVLNSQKDIFKYKNKSLMAFSKSGFTEDAIEYAKNNDIRLVSFEMM